MSHFFLPALIVHDFCRIGLFNLYVSNIATNLIRSFKSNRLGEIRQMTETG